MTLTGDDAANQIRIRQITVPSVDGRFPGVTLELKGIKPQNDGETSTTINGQSTYTVAGIKNGVVIQLGLGRDELIMNNPVRFRPESPNKTSVLLPGFVNIEAEIVTAYIRNKDQVSVDLGGDVGTYERSLNLVGTEVRNLVVDGSNYSDRLAFRSFRPSGNVLVRAGGGDDRIDFYAPYTKIDAALTVNAGTGDDVIRFVSATDKSLDDPAGWVRVRGPLVVNGGEGRDEIYLSGVFLSSSARLSGGDDDDKITVKYTEGSSLSIIGGDGANDHFFSVGGEFDTVDIEKIEFDHSSP